MAQEEQEFSRVWMEWSGWYRRRGEVAGSREGMDLCLGHCRALALPLHKTGTTGGCALRSGVTPYSGCGTHGGHGKGWLCGPCLDSPEKQKGGLLSHDLSVSIRC